MFGIHLPELELIESRTHLHYKRKNVVSSQEPLEQPLLKGSIFLRCRNELSNLINFALDITATNNGEEHGESSSIK